MLILCLSLFLRETNPIPDWLYIVYLVAIATDVVRGPIALSRYRYEKPPNVVASE